VRRAKFEALEDRHLLAVLTVNSPLDNNTPNDGLVTLREAIFVANTDTMTDLGESGSGADTIVFAPEVFSTAKTLALSLGQLVISQPLTLDGPGRELFTIDAQNNSRIFEIFSSGVTVSGLTLARGRAPSDGGAIRTTSGVTTIDDCIIRDSSVLNSGGGAISFSNHLFISNSILSGNKALSGHGGALFATSSGNNSRLRLTNSTLSGNSASGSGGGLYARSDIEIINSTLTGNMAGSRGGGFALYFNATMYHVDVPEATLINATISGNSAVASGGGFSGAYIQATDSVISDNSTQGFGGGFAAPAQKAPVGTNIVTGDVQLIDCLISGNTAGTTGGGFFAGNIGTLTNTVVTKNQGGGIHSVHDITLNSSTVSNNTNSGPGGGILTTGSYTTFGTKYYKLAPVTLNSSTITGNKSSRGGGIYARGDVNARYSTIADNQATGDGAGIFVRETIQFNRHSSLIGIFGRASVAASTVSGNQSGGEGGGIHARFVSLETSTVSGNTAVAGGGIYSYKEGGILSSTIANNHATTGTGGGIWNGDNSILAGQLPIASPLSISGSIVAGNTAGGGSPDLRAGTGALSVNSSLIGDNAGTALVESHVFDANGNLIGSAAGAGIISPRLAPLADNGGPTRTHTLLPDSPAIDPMAIPGPNEPMPAHVYLLNSTLADTEHGPSLVALGGSLTDSAYDFGPNQGLNLSSALANPAQYSIELKFLWDTVTSGGQKILDFKNLTSNAGLYTTNAGLQFLGGPFAAQVFLPNVFYRLVLTRDDATDIVRAYLNGAEVWNFVDAAGDAVFTGPDNIIRFFQDDNTTGQTQAHSGIVDFIRIYHSVLTASEVANLSDPIVPTFSYDQRGEPFRRHRDGNGDGIVGRDTGSFELQTIPNTLPVVTSPATMNVVQDTTDVMLLTATDADVPPQIVTFSIVGGADQDKFVIPPPSSFDGPFDVPNAHDTYSGGINDTGTIVGGVRFPLPLNQFTEPRGFFSNGIEYSILEVPQSLNTVALDINSANEIVGNFSDSAGQAHGFLFKNGVYQPIDFPGGHSTNVWTINDLGQFAGSYVDGNGKRRGFMFDGVAYSTIHVPGADETFVHGISDSGLVVGLATGGTASGGFMFDGTNFHTIRFPGSSSTVPNGISSDGIIVGSYTVSGSSGGHGFVYDGFKYTTLDFPEVFNSTALSDINDDGKVVGTYEPIFQGEYRSHVFTAQLPSRFNHSAPLQFIAPPDFDAPTDTNRDNVYEVVVQARDSLGGTTTQTIQVAVTSSISIDYGDAPDASAGSGPGNYNTRVADNGPSHTIVAGLRMGANVDGDDGTLQNAAASADDVNGALPDDEDGLSNPAVDLVLTVGAQPAVNVRVTNTTGSAATLYGWIDYNANGVFDNATERTSVAVPNGTNNSVVTMTFPAVPSGFVGSTYARFRLSTDGAAANAVGPAADGEVEDYRTTIALPASAVADSAKNKKVASGTSGGPALADGDKFGSAAAAIGDLDGDGVGDMVVGAPSRFGAPSPGHVQVLFMNANGTVKSSQRIASGIGGGPTLANGDYFGHGVAAIGDLDGDGVTDLAVGASKDDTGGYNNGAVYVLFMNANGTVKNSQKIATSTGGGPMLASSDRFGSAVAGIGDLDGDGVTDLAVGASGDDTGGTYRGAVHILLMNPNGTAKASQKIAHGVGGGSTLANFDFFGGAVANVGDLDGDGHTELSVGASGDDVGGSGRGAVHVLFLNPNGTVKAIRKIASGTSGGPVLANDDGFGRSVASVGDLDGDGVTDLAVGAYGDDTGGSGRGALHVLLMNVDGTVKSGQKIASGVGGGPTLANDDRFGSAVALLGDLDGDGRIELAVGAETDDTGGDSRGAVHLLFLASTNTAPVFTSPAQVSVPENVANVQTVTAIDAEGQPITFQLAGGPDQSNFSITTGGALSFIPAPNFEAPMDANADNVYIVIVQASDGNLASFQAIAVTVTPVNDNNPVFTSPTTASIVENTTSVMTVTATDADLPAQTVTLTIVGGADQSKFTLTGGQLAFITPPDFESPTDANGDNIYEVVVQADDGNGRTTLQTINVTVLRPPADDGDAPDAAPGVGRGNYNTREADNGPAHLIVPGLRLGASVDGDSGSLENVAANADDVNAALPDDEDGLINPSADLALTIGAQPRVRVRVTNTTGAPATLFGWVDYNANGVFDITERQSIAVPNNTVNSLVTLVLPRVPATYFGDTFARFRLSTNAAAGNPTGFVSDGEVEDYPATIVKPSELTVASPKTHKIAYNTGDPIDIQNTEQFALSTANIGDVDGDGVIDLAVGTNVISPNVNSGGMFILFMNPNGTVRSSQEISSGVGGGPVLESGSQFGLAVAGLGDLDGDGVPDIAVGNARGSVYVLFLNTNGTVKRSTVFGGGSQSPGYFGASIASLGDFDGDGVSDMAVGARGGEGAVFICLMTPQGTVKSSTKIADGISGQFYDRGFGISVASLGDSDGDGVTDIAAGAWRATNDRGAVHVLRLNANGTVKQNQLIGHGSGGMSLNFGDNFGRSVAALGDIDGDGVNDLAVGAFGENGPAYGQVNRGAIYTMMLDSNGGVRRIQKITDGIGGGPSLAQFELFGRTIAPLGDLDGDGNTDLAVGSYGVGNSGAVYAMFLNETNTPPVFTSPPTATVAENTSAVMTVTATDVNIPPQTITFSIAGGGDQSRFSITSSGVLSFNSPPNFEQPTDANADNLYNVVVRATDSLGSSTTQAINVTVTPVNDNPPVFTSPDAVNVAENSTSVMTLMATDADLPPQVVSFSIVGGEDQSKFSVTAGGVLSFNSPPDFEAPSDANGDNIYIVVLQASDGIFTDLHALLVTVTNVNEPPVVLAGDYNNNGTVDAADYVVWRKLLNQNVTVPNDTTPGTVTQADYTVWRANFGRSVTPGSGANIPELTAQSDGSIADEQHAPGTAAAAVLSDESAAAAAIDPLVSAQAVGDRPHAFHRAHRDRLTTPELHDDALQAWLFSKYIAKAVDSSSERSDELPVDHERQEPRELVDALDLAFAALEVTS
jgi:hypothetical protein